MMSLQLALYPPGGPFPDMRARKKARTRLSIQDAALELFADQGFDETTVEQIVQRADVSASTFFRYFGTKGDIVLNDHESQLPELCAAMRRQPEEVGEFEAVRLALQAAWVPNVDAVRTIRTARAVARSAFLRGLAYDMGVGWMEAVAAVLVERRGNPQSYDECLFVARTALGVFGSALTTWVSRGGSDDFGMLVDRGFGLIKQLGR